MQRYRIRHQTIDNYGVDVWLDAHTLRLRLRQGHELRIDHSREGQASSISSPIRDLPSFPARPKTVHEHTTDARPAVSGVRR
jgi:hypothetical protein